MDLHQAAAMEWLLLWGRAARLPMNCSPRLQRKERRAGQTDCNSGLVTGPEMGLSSGCFVGPELIEGES